MILELFVLALPVLLILALYSKEKDKGSPPGPFQWPFFGNKLVGSDKQVIEMQKKYGDIFRIKFGKAQFVYIADYKITKEAFGRPEYSARFPWQITLLTERERREKDCNGLILSSGQRSQHNRRFVLRHLKDHGMGKPRMESVILRETEVIIEELRKLDGKPSSLPFVIQLTILNIVWDLVASHRYTTDDIPSVEKFISSFKKAEEVFGKVAMFEVFPILNYLPNFVRNWMEISSFPDCITQMGEHMKPFIEEHKLHLDPDNPKDFIDDYLVEMKKEKDDECSLFNEDDLFRNIFDLFIAGMDTTNITFSWFVLYMAEFQDEQKKCQDLLDSVVGDEKLPGLEHRNKLQYIDAMINEVLRFSSLASFAEWHYTTQDTTLRDFFMPKGTTVLTAAGFIHKDVRYWDEPNKFKPSRFINSDGKFVPQKEGFLPFGVGRRACIGEALARMELFLLFSATLKNFTIKPCNGEKIDLEPKPIDLGNFPKDDQKVIFSPRN